MEPAKKGDRQKLSEWTIKYLSELHKHTEHKNWEKLEKLLSMANNMGVPSTQLQKSWTALARYQKQQHQLASALVSFASARFYNVDNAILLYEILDCLNKYINETGTQLSREDLAHLEHGLYRLYTFQKTRPKTPDVDLQLAKELLTRIRHAKSDAPSKLKTPATTNVFRIFSALYPNMSQEEVKVEFARIVAPLVRKKLSEGNTDKPPGKKRSKKGKQKKKDK